MVVGPFNEDYEVRIGICDMEASFVPRTGNQMGVSDADWQARPPEERLRRALAIIGESPFEFVELGVPWINDGPMAFSADHIESILRDTGVSVGAYNSLIPPDMPVVGPAIEWNLVQDYLENVFANCNRLGGTVVVFGSGESRQIPPGYSEEQAVTDIVRFLRLGANVIEENNYQLRIAVEALNTDECNFLNTLGETASVVRQVDSEKIGLLVDCYHMCLQNNDYWTELEQAMDLVIHVQAVEPGTRRRPGHDQDSRFDYGRFFRLLNERQYPGNLSVEAIFENLSEEISPCHAFLQRLVR